MNTPKHILIVEDELLIAKQIQMHIEDKGYKCAGIAIDCKGALEILDKAKVDLVLLDINLSGLQNGLDVAKYLTTNHKIPFMFLTSYNDDAILQKIKGLRPIGYINKPINEVTLTTNLDIYFNQNQPDQTRFSTIKVGSKTITINLSELRYVEAEHVYIHLYYQSRMQLIRCALSRFLDLIPDDRLLQINRSTAVNPDYIQVSDKSNLVVLNKRLKISRTYLDSFQNFLSQ